MFQLVFDIFVGTFPEQIGKTCGKNLETIRKCSGKFLEIIRPPRVSGIKFCLAPRPQISAELQQRKLLAANTKGREH